MPYIDSKGRPEILVHPAIKLGLANYRPMDEAEDPEQPAASASATPRKRAPKKPVSPDKGRGPTQQKTGGNPDK